MVLLKAISQMLTSLTLIISTACFRIEVIVEQPFSSIVSYIDNCCSFTKLCKKSTFFPSQNQVAKPAILYLTITLPVAKYLLKVSLVITIF